MAVAAGCTLRGLLASRIRLGISRNRPQSSGSYAAILFFARVADVVPQKLPFRNPRLAFRAIRLSASFEKRCQGVSRAFFERRTERKAARGKTSIYTRTRQCD